MKIKKYFNKPKFVHKVILFYHFCEIIALRVESVYFDIVPPNELLKGLSKSYLSSNNIILHEMIHYLRILQLFIIQISLLNGKF